MEEALAQGQAQSKDVTRDVAKAPDKAKWLAADDPGNPFGVEVLDLMITQALIATSSEC